MTRILNVVYLENAADQVDIVRQSLSNAGLDPEIQVARTRDEFVRMITESTPDIILSEYILPDITCSQALKIVREHGLMIPFIVISDAVSDEMAEDMLHMGVDDYMIKSQPGRLPFAVHKALDTFSVKREQQSLVQQLGDRELHFRTLVENSTDAVVILDKTGQPTYVSLAVKNVLGYTPEEVLNMDIFSKAHPDDLAGLHETMMKVTANPGKPIPGHTGRMLHKDGTWRWIEATVTNLLHEPSINGIVDNFRDVTSQKVGEEKILHLNRLYAFLSQVNRTLVHAPDAQTVFREVCRIACETGQFEAAWIGMFASNDNRIDVAAEQNVTAAFLQGFASAATEHRLLREILASQPYYVLNDTQAAPISEYWKTLAATAGYHSCMILPIRKSGDIVGTFNLYGSQPDIFTEAEIRLLEEAAMGISFSLDFFEKEKQKLIADEQLRHKEKRLSQAQAIAHLGSWETDLVRNSSVWSDEACKIFGLREDENIQTLESWLSFIHPDDLDYVIKCNQRVLDTMQPADYHHRIIRRDGQVRHLHVQTHIELNGAGEPVSLYGVLHDVTEQKQAEEALRNYANELIESNKGLDQFAYIVSHNLRAPVANIIGLGELIAQEEYPPHVKEKFLDGIIVNVKRLDTVISDLNTILQVKQGLSESKEPVNLQSIVDNIRSSLLNIVEKEQVSIVTDFSAAQELFTLKTYLYSIFYNLIINSIKYRRPDVPPVIQISSSVEADRLTIFFRDNGMGIDLDRKGAQIFGLYKRFHNHVEGKGLGLFMVKTQVEMLGGKIYVSSAVNEGTEFKIEFCSDLCHDPVV